MSTRLLLHVFVDKKLPAFLNTSVLGYLTRLQCTDLCGHKILRNLKLEWWVGTLEAPRLTNDVLRNPFWQRTKLIIYSSLLTSSTEPYDLWSAEFNMRHVSSARGIFIYDIWYIITGNKFTCPIIMLIFILFNFWPSALMYISVWYYILNMQ